MRYPKSGDAKTCDAQSNLAGMWQTLIGARPYTRYASYRKFLMRLRVELSSVRDQLSGIKAFAFDFDGVFTDNRVYVSQSGEEAVVCDRSDGMGISMLRDANVPMVIISTEQNPVVTVRGQKFGVAVFQGVDNKLQTLTEWAAGLSLAIQDIGFVGNDINDVECIQAAGLGIVVSDAYPVAADVASLRLTREGGKGAIRELADMWLAVHS